MGNPAIRCTHERHFSIILKVLVFLRLLCSLTQTLLQRAPEKAASTTRFQSLSLRQALQRAEVRRPRTICDITASMGELWSNIHLFLRC